MNFEPTVQQRLAIESPLGPVLVMAGPGAGKTYCLICRVQHLIQELGIAPRRILAVTFTNKAAEEIALRLNISRETVKKHVSEALRIIRGQLQRYIQLPQFCFLLFFR